VTELGDVGFAGERRRVQRFDVRKPLRELQALEVDATIHDGVEHEAIVWAGRESERQLHTCSRMPRAHRFRLSIASPRFHASRFRFSTMFATARTCANGTWLMRHACMNAAPSMLSTCGENLR